MDKYSQNKNNDGNISLDDIIAEFGDYASLSNDGAFKMQNSDDGFDDEAVEAEFKNPAFVNHKKDVAQDNNVLKYPYREEEMSELEREFFGVGKYAREHITEDVATTQPADEATYEQKLNKDAPTQREKRKHFEASRIRKENRKKKKNIEDEIEECEEAEEEYEPAEMSRRYGATLNSLFIRGIFASVISVAMLFFTFADNFGWKIPDVFVENKIIFCSFMLLFVMLLGLDILIVGIKDLLHIHPKAESLIALSCFVSLIDAVVLMFTNGDLETMPFCTVSAISLAFSIWGLRYSRLSMRTTLSTASISANPYIVTNQSNMVDKGDISVKSYGSLSGVVRNSEQPDIVERVFSLAAPMFIVASFVLALLASVARGRTADFVHCWSAISAVAAQFSMLLSFAIPFYIISKKLMRSGAAITGWVGANEINRAVGIVVTDEDVFPTGTLAMNGIKVFGRCTVQKAAAYTGSLIIASGSGLSNVFKECMAQYGCSRLKVEELSCYEAGGIGATVAGEHVLVGASSFMNLMSIRLPQELNVKNAVFAAINNELVAVFALNYTPVSSVQNALVVLLRTKITTIFAVRDFNISKRMIAQKFKISADKVDFLTVEDRYKLSEQPDMKYQDPLAVLCREGLGPFAEAVAGSKRLVRVSAICTAISVIGALIGILIMFYLCWNNDFTAASVSNTLLYMFMWAIPVLLIGCSAGMY